MDRLFDIFDPWKISTILFPIITFVLGFYIQKRLTRYRERISRLHGDLNAVRDICKHACIAASSLKPCLYTESGNSLEPNQQLHQIVEYPTFHDRKLLKELRRFLQLANEQRNVFSWGSGSAHILVDYSSGGQAYHEICRDGNDAKLLPNLSDEQREQLLHTAAGQLREIFEGIDRRIEKLLR
jgi:hypothetical protein